MNDVYPEEVLGEDEDNGTMPGSLEALRKAVVGRRIVKAEKTSWWRPRFAGSENSSHETGIVLTLDDGTQARMREVSDCCAYAAVKAFLLHPDKVDHVIMGVGTTEGYTRWHIYADWGDVLELTVGWSCGNPFYYGYGFDIDVVPVAS